MHIDYEHLKVHFEKAKESRCDSSTLSTLVEALRDQSLSAVEPLTNGLRWLAYKATFAFCKHLRRFDLKSTVDDYISEAHLALYRAIELLAENDETEVESFVGRFIFRRLRSVFKRESRNIYVPSSTLSTQKAKGRERYRSLHCRRSGSVHSEHFLDEQKSADSPIEHPELPETTQSGKPYRVPSKYLNQTEKELLGDWRDIRSTYVKTHRERCYLSLRWKGYTVQEIAKRFGVSYHTVRYLRRRLLAQASGIPVLSKYVTKMQISTHSPFDRRHKSRQEPKWLLQPSGLARANSMRKSPVTDFALAN